MKKKPFRVKSLSAAVAALVASVTVLPVTVLAQESAGPTEELLVLGTRRDDRSIIESTVPVDVISAEDIKRSGVTQTVELLQQLIPSFTAQKNSITDATDYIRPAQLRGLGPEHVLVLVNGKRRHLSSVVHDNEQARGSVHVDLNSIPPSSIERIDVLRDGAAAQYGSDAIAGVINITLKKSTELQLSATYGSNYSTENRGYQAKEGLTPEEKANPDAANAGYSAGTFIDWTDRTSKKDHTDGENTILSIAKGFEFTNGFVHGSLQYWKQGRADRAGTDPNYQYWGQRPDGTYTFSGTEINNSLADDDASNDIRIDPREYTIDGEGWWFGKSEMTDISGFFNSEYNFSNNAALYSFGGVSKRRGRGPCFWREPGSNNNVRSIHPDGYLPNVTPRITDRSLAVGVRGEAGSISYDASQTYGHNDFNFRGETLNVSLGNDSPTKFDGGGTRFTQYSTNLDMSTAFDIGLASDLNLAWGVEYRQENYEIYPGQEEAYSNGGVPVLDGPNAGRTAVVGTQCVQAFHRVDAVDEGRSNVAAYVDAETDISDAFTLGVALRAEDYSDFGSTANGKISARYAFNDELALRAAVSTGFRAPALQQQYYSNRSLQSNPDGSLSQTGIFPIDTTVAEALGAVELEAEKSTSASLGFTYNGGDVTLTIDAYKVDIDDRILLSEQFDGRSDTAAFRSFLDSLAGGNPDFLGIQKVGFFINGLDTETEGVDLILKWSASSELDLIAAYNHTETDVVGVADTPSQLAVYTPQDILGATNINNIENAAPSDTLHLTADYNEDKWGVLWRSIYYGSITAAERFSDNNEQYFQKYDGEFIHNVEGTYRFLDDRLNFSLGVNNLLDTYPDKRYKAMSRNGILPYSGYVPYGFTGRYVYTRLTFTL